VKGEEREGWKGRSNPSRTKILATALAARGDLYDYDIPQRHTQTTLEDSYVYRAVKTTTYSAIKYRA